MFSCAVVFLALLIGNAVLIASERKSVEDFIADATVLFDNMLCIVSNGNGFGIVSEGNVQVPYKYFCYYLYGIPMATYRGKFKPRNPNKYKGDFSNIVYRSSWELKLMAKLDAHPDVIWWSSEEISIPYRSPVDGKMHRYFPDFVVHMKNKQGVFETVMIEVKPKSQTMEPKKQSNVTKKYLKEVCTWGINSSKWTMAEEYCKDRGWKFQIMSEKDLGIK